MEGNADVCSNAHPMNCKEGVRKPYRNKRKKLTTLECFGCWKEGVRKLQFIDRGSIAERRESRGVAK
jgi:hypothetical protein